MNKIKKIGEFVRARNLKPGDTIIRGNSITYPDPHHGRRRENDSETMFLISSTIHKCFYELTWLTSQGTLVTSYANITPNDPAFLVITQENT